MAMNPMDPMLPMALRYQQMRGGFGPGATGRIAQMMGGMAGMPNTQQQSATPPPDPFQPGAPPPTAMMPSGPGAGSVPMKPPPPQAQFDPKTGDWTPGPGGFPGETDGIMGQIMGQLGSMMPNAPGIGSQVMRPQGK